MKTESHLSPTFLTECKQRLINLKAELLNQIFETRQDFQARETGGDEIDQSTAMIHEAQMMSAQTRQRIRLMEIEAALSRIQTGDYGFCEETDEPIEPARLLALPWTRLSLEGAERREEQARRRTANAL